jgi:hypothetical protein
MTQAISSPEANQHEPEHNNQPEPEDQNLPEPMGNPPEAQSNAPEPEATTDKETTAGKPISAAKLEANRRNAQLSTGPKTEAGKSWSRRNALKHGIFATDMLVYGESFSDYKQLLEALLDDFAPVGAFEESRVQTIAICCWRQKRVLRCEAGLIRGAADVAGKMWPSDNLPRYQEDVNRVLRYDIMLQRQLASALDQLERLQRTRKAKEEAAAKQAPADQ